MGKYDNQICSKENTLSKLKTLYRIKVLTPKGLYHLLLGFIRDGKTMNTLLYFCSKMYPNKTALILDKVKYSYCNLYKLTLNLASNLAHIYDLQHGDRVAMIARNSIESAVALFALSRVGVNVYLLNPEMSDSQFKSLFEQRNVHDISKAPDNVAGRSKSSNISPASALISTCR